jgi:chitinase
MRLTTLFTAGFITLAAARPAVVGYYADWTSPRLPPTKIPYTRLTHINYAFALCDSDGTVTVPTAALLQQVVSLAHARSVKVLLSVGGWTGSVYFSTLMANADKRSYLAQQFLDLVTTYNLDGIDIDWEFPGREGAPGNALDPANDSDNLLLFLREYKVARTQLKRATELTMAVRIAPFDKDGAPLLDVRAFATVTDRINIMAYDMYGPWSGVTGPNAALTNPVDASNSDYGAVNAWYKAKWPLSKIALGLPFYGRSVTTKQGVSAATKAKVLAGQKVTLKLMGVPILSTPPMGDADDAEHSGVWKWSGLRTTGPLGTNTRGWVSGWDDPTRTPWFYNVLDKTFITYDDTRSLGLKSTWAVCKAKLGGVMIWDLSQDYKNELINAVYKAVQC